MATEATTRAPAVEMRRVVKRYGEVKALGSERECKLDRTHPTEGIRGNRERIPARDQEGLPRRPGRDGDHRKREEASMGSADQ